jgi:hypothetical protein
MLRKKVIPTTTLFMKKRLLPALFVLLQMAAKAQSSPPGSGDKTLPYPRWSLSLEAGPAFPIGSFAHFRTPVNGYGDVHNGAAVQFSAAWRFSRYISATIAGSEQQNKGDGITYFDPGTPIDRSPSSPDWKSSRLIAGAVYFFPYSKKISVAP